MITAEETQAIRNAGPEGSPLGTPSTKAFATVLLLGGLFALSSSPALAVVYDKTCASPGATKQVWYINPGAATGSFGAGDAPDAAHGGTGKADGSQAHPFNSLQAVFRGGKITPVAGYGYPLLSTAPYDHYGVSVGFGVGVGAHRQRKDTDWVPAAPVATRINPGDEIVLAPGSYGDLQIGYPGIQTANVGPNGNTDFVTITGAPGWASTFTTIGLSGARGFAINGLMAKSTIGVGVFNENTLLTIGGSTAAPSQDILVVGWFQSFGSFIDVNTQYKASGSRYGNELAFLRAKLRNGIYIAGGDQPGATNRCISVANGVVQFVATGAAVVNSSKVLLYSNHFNHYGMDGVDILSNDFSAVANLLNDPINLQNGVHPDGFQTQNSSAAPGPFSNTTLDRNSVLERTDPTNPYPQTTTFAQVAANNLRVTNNRSMTSNCPGLNLGVASFNAIIANNSIVGNGVTPGAGCPAPQSGETGGANNLWVNNVVAGRFYQACNGSVWKNNVQIPSRSAGKSTPDILSYCKDGKIALTATPGVYNGVTIYTTDLATFAFTSYAPSATGLSTTINLQPVMTGPLYGTGFAGAAVPTLNIDGKTRTPRVNIGAY